MLSSAAGFAGKTMAGPRDFPVQFLYRQDSVPELAARQMAPYLAGQRAPRSDRPSRQAPARAAGFCQPGRAMKPINAQNIAALAGIAALCALAFLCLCLSPAFAATLPRGADLGTALAVMRSMIYPVCAIKFRLPPFGASARVSMDRLMSMF
jgi:hypothetical protein